MRFLDANIFLTVLVRPADETEEAKERACRALFDRILEGKEQALTDPVIVAEVAYVLRSPKKYRMSPPEIAASLRPLVELTGLQMANKAKVLRALDIWPLHPRLDFEDVFAITLIEGNDPGEIYSYDHDFDRIPGIERVEPQ